MTNGAEPGNANLPTGAADQEIGVPGWHSRHYLPHFESADRIQHVTFHLADSMAKEAMGGMEAEIYLLPPEKQKVERRKKFEEWIDSGQGSCILREPPIAEMMRAVLHHFNSQRYRLFAWVIMPNHVHVLFQPLNGWTVARIVASWKKFSAAKISQYRSAAGNANLPIGAADQEIDVPAKRVWHREYWDRYIRSETHLRQTVAYIHENPVKAGLVPQAEDWRWSSAYIGANQEIGVPRGGV